MEAAEQDRGLIAHYVVAHPDRWREGGDLSADLAPGEPVGVPMFVDEEGLGERANHVRALASFVTFSDADWCILVEDDAILCRDYHERLPGFLAGAGPVASLYLGTGRWAGMSRRHGDVIEELVAQADEEGRDWIEGEGLWHAVGVAVRREVARPLLDFLTRVKLPTDQAIGHWVRMEGAPVRYPLPSLLDHRDGPPVIKGRMRSPIPRRAWRFDPA